MKRKYKILFFLAIGTLAGLGYLAYRIMETVNNAYAMWWAGDLVVAYLEANDGAWPRSWDDLRGVYEKFERRPFSFEELRGRVDIDWTVDPKEILDEEKSGSVLKRDLVRTKSGEQTHWERADPDEIIRHYLVQKSRRPQVLSDVIRLIREAEVASIRFGRGPERRIASQDIVNIGDWLSRSEPAQVEMLAYGVVEFRKGRGSVSISFSGGSHVVIHYTDPTGDIFRDETREGSTEFLELVKSYQTDR